MKKLWLNAILHLSSRIYKIKNKILQANPLQTFALALELIILEVVISIISLPQYFYIIPSPEKQEKLGNATYEIKAYQLRKAITLTAIFVTLLILFIKTLLVLPAFLAN